MLPWPELRLVVDVVMLTAAGFAATLGDHTPGLSVRLLVAYALTTLVVGASVGLYRRRLVIDVLEDVRRVLQTTTLAALIVLGVRVLALGQQGPTLTAGTIRPWAFATFYLVAAHVVIARAEALSRREGESVRRAVLVGAGPATTRLLRRVAQRPDLGFHLVGVVCAVQADSDSPLPWLGDASALEWIIRKERIEHVIVNASGVTDLDQVLDTCRRMDIELSVLPAEWELLGGRFELDHLGVLPLVTPRPVSDRDPSFVLKRVLDRLIALVLLVITAPLFLGIAVAVRLSVGRPLLFRQTRIGRAGKPFTMLKFRTMHAAPARDESAIALEPGSAPGGVEGSDRRTRVGAVLRKTSLDELPQLFNVLCGDMSLVGPRPERPEFVETFSESVDGYSRRHRVDVGITGWAQVHGLRGKTSIADRAEADNFYIEHHSLWLDVKTMLLTVAEALRGFARVE